MREIKFRMWHKNIKQMYDVGLINLQQGLIFIKNYLVYTQSSFAIEEVELMQYTGLKDKNGKEIYEGDIVKIDCPTMKMTGEIKYSEMSAMFYIYDVIEDIEETLWYQKEEYEVIGNIYKNPELLEER